MRPWLVLTHSGLSFEEVLIELDLPGTTAQLRELSPSGRVPCLHHGSLRVWDSLAICEYVAELAPNRNLWPQDPRRRAIARSYAAEMHSGFESLRQQLSMDIRLRMEIRHLSSGTITDIKRIIKLWESALTESKGPYLFGEFSVADAFYAPVVFRFLSYGVPISSQLVTQYMRAIEQFEPVRQWVDAAVAERAAPLSL